MADRKARKRSAWRKGCSRAHRLIDEALPGRSAVYPMRRPACLFDEAIAQADAAFESLAASVKIRVLFLVPQIEQRLRDSRMGCTDRTAASGGEEVEALIDELDALRAGLAGAAMDKVSVRLDYAQFLHVCGERKQALEHRWQAEQLLSI